MIVIAIIGILASVVLVNLNSSRLKARAAQYKSVVSSLNTALLACCDSTGATITLYRGGTDICNPAVGALWPTADHMGGAIWLTVSDHVGCGANGFYTVDVNTVGHSLGACSSRSTRLTPTGVDFPDGC